MMILTQLLIHSILVVFLGIDFQRFLKQKFANNLDYRISVHFLILPSTFFLKKNIPNLIVIANSIELAKSEIKSQIL